MCMFSAGRRWSLTHQKHCPTAAAALLLSCSCMWQIQARTRACANTKRNTAKTTISDYDSVHMTDGQSLVSHRRPKVLATETGQREGSTRGSSPEQVHSNFSIAQSRATFRKRRRSPGSQNQHLRHEWTATRCAHLS